jgi:hypothetical protein
VRSCLAVQERSFAAGFHRCHVTRFEAGRRMPNPENPAMNGDEDAFFDPMPDLGLGHAGTEDLLPGQYSV